MRKSVEKRRAAAQRPAHIQKQPPRFLLSVLIVFAVAACSALFLAYSDWRQTTTAKAVKTEQAREFALLDKRVAALKQKKIDDALKAEANAKAKIESGQTAGSQPTTTRSFGTADSTSCGVVSPASMTVVVNKKHCFSPLDWTPGDLTPVDGFPLRQEAATHLEAMLQAAAAAGAPLTLTSGYRSYSDQKLTYDTWAVSSGYAAADAHSALPGYSEHQSGLAVDLKAGSCALECFATTPQYAWLIEHAADYGYMLRYPKSLDLITGYTYEPWHWRYVGAMAAKDMKAKGIETLEKYFGISGGDYANELAGV